ncbi:MAG TPA: heme-binding protein [Candidatus Polarisedimenticolia bacterium]|nr:heme-binding protein [Candidatus Polarisedimenticolia bacterium]
MQSIGRLTLIGVAALALAAGVASPQVADKKVLTLAGARAVAAAAEAEAGKSNSGGGIAIVDDGGHLIYFERLDNTFPAAANISVGKARSAATFRKATAFFEEAIKNGRTSLVANPELLPLQGGEPIVVDGQVVGAVGVAGAASAQTDEEIAKAASAALGKPEGHR